MPFLLAEILNFQGSTHLIGVGSLSKVITGIRRCGKSYLLNNLFYHHLLESGVMLTISYVCLRLSGRPVPDRRKPYWD